MGWSCSAAASRVADSWVKACWAQTGGSNTFEHEGRSYFWEESRKEHDDGAITGSVHLMLEDNRCQRVGSFAIEGDGRVSRCPRYMRQALGVSGADFPGTSINGS